MSDEKPGRLIVVATPIGNLADISQRAVEALGAADWVAAEDTRHTGRLLAHLGLNKRLLSLHAFNERERSASILDRVRGGEVVALVSDAGTPLISDPGYPLIRQAHEAGLAVTTVPGPCAAIAALSVSGLPTDHFVFEGFLPPRSGQRRKRLEALAGETRTLVVYESPHRIAEALTDMAAVLGEGRQAFLGRELTKAYETLYWSTLGGLATQVRENDQMRRGEMVLVVGGAEVPPAGAEGTDQADALLRRLLPELPVKKVARIVADLTGLPRNQLYQRALALQHQAD